MRKIFIFWIIFLIILAAGIILAISSKSVLRREEERSAELKKAVISRPSRLPKMPAVSEVKTEQPKGEVQDLPKAGGATTAETQAAAPAERSPSPSLSGELPPMQNNVPVEINANSVEISVPVPQSSNPLPELQQGQTAPLPGQ